MNKASPEPSKKAHAARSTKLSTLAKKTRATQTALEATSYLRGLFQEFCQQRERYASLTSELLSLEARVELVERNLCLTRDHLAMVIEKTDCAVPHDWSNVLKGVRFVGMRLADACVSLLQEHKKMSPKEILLGLNTGMFRFRTNSPLREIHAALLRQSSVKRVGNDWVWTGTGDQIRMRWRVLKKEMIETPPTAVEIEQ